MAELAKPKRLKILSVPDWRTLKSTVEHIIFDGNEPITVDDSKYSLILESAEKADIIVLVFSSEMSAKDAIIASHLKMYFHKKVISVSLNDFNPDEKDLISQILSNDFNAFDIKTLENFFCD